MIASFFGRRVVPTPVDPVPLGMRCLPGLIVLCEREIKALEAGDQAVARQVIAIIRDADTADMRRTVVKR